MTQFGLLSLNDISDRVSEVKIGSQCALGHIGVLHLLAVPSPD